MKRIILFALLALFFCGEAQAIIFGQGNVTTSTGGGGTTASDDFNRANYSNLGANWTTITGQSDLLVESNQWGANTVVRRGAWWNADTFGDDQCSQTKITNIPSGATIGTGVRIQSSTQEGYFGVYDDSLAIVAVKKLVNGSWGTLDTAATSVSANDVIKTCIVGTTLSVYINDSLIKSVTDTDFSSGQPGLFSYAVGVLGDDWSGWDL